MTFGEYIRMVEARCSTKKETIFESKQRLRVLLASMFGIDVANKKYDHFNKLNKKYEEEAFSIKIEQVTAGRVEEWKCMELRRRVEFGKNRGSAATTINSIIHGCNGLFSGKILKELGLCGKFVSPFANVLKLQEGSKCYYSNFSAKELLANAEKELRETRPDEFIIIMLALLQGLRANEIDKMIWSQVNLSDGTLSVLQTNYFIPKTRSSCKTIPLNDYVAEVLQWHRENRKAGDGEFVIAPGVGFKKTEITREKRCVKQMRGAIAWLRNFGIKDQKPIHTLRKECGSMIYRQTGDINATRLFLRDNTMSVVINHYADSTVVRVPKLDLRAGTLD
jgi:hypothetical protein